MCGKLKLMFRESVYPTVERPETTPDGYPQGFVDYSLVTGVVSY